MGECGCTTNDRRYRIPGPDKTFYLLTLSGACENCDAPPGITIEVITPEHTLYREYKRGEFNDGQLKFEKWRDSRGVAIVCGMRKHEFVKAILPHLIGLDSKELGDEGKLDEAGAEVVIEEMYDDSQTRPAIV